MRGVVTQTGIEFRARAVVLTVGTFLGGKHPRRARRTIPAVAPAIRRRTGSPSACARCRSASAGSRPARRRASTAARIDYSGLPVQPGDEPVPVFSYLGRRSDHPRQVPLPHHGDQRAHARDHPRRLPIARRCSPARSKASVRATARRSRTRSCASRTRRRTRSSSSPKGSTTHEVYPNGISTSLPFDVQLAFVRTIRASSTRTSRGPATRSSTTSSIRAICSTALETKFVARAVLRRPDQRHHRLRRGGRAGPARRHQRRAARAGARRRGGRAATRPTSACSSTT